MSYLIHVFYGIIIAYLAMISPGMLNMTALKFRIENGTIESFKFALGASIIIFLQAGIALFFADYFVKNPEIIENLKIAGIFIFFILSVFFYSLSKKRINPKTSSTKGNFFLKGIIMSALNMLSIPFYLAISIFLANKEHIVIRQPYIMFFIFGVFLGALLLFYTYVHFAKLITQKVSFIAKNINLILSGLFMVLGIMTLVRLFN